MPRDRASLEALPGVGRKTANVVLNTAFGEPTIAVDTHIFRVANRTGMAPGADVDEVERRLEKFTPDEFRKDAHHWLILHGRYICKARSPECWRCPISRVVRVPPEDTGARAGEVRLSAPHGMRDVFTPTKEEVRRFFRETWRKHRAGEVLTPIEAMALDWIIEHPEYHDELANSGAEDSRVSRRGRPHQSVPAPVDAPGDRRAIVDRPATRHTGGVRAARAARGDAHAAAHEVMECLGEIVWTAQRAGQALPPEEMSARYLDCLARRAGDA